MLPPADHLGLPAKTCTTHYTGLEIGTDEEYRCALTNRVHTNPHPKELLRLMKYECESQRLHGTKSSR